LKVTQFVFAVVATCCLCHCSQIRALEEAAPGEVEEGMLDTYESPGVELETTPGRDPNIPNEFDRPLLKKAKYE